MGDLDVLGNAWMGVQALGLVEDLESLRASGGPEQGFSGTEFSELGGGVPFQFWLHELWTWCREFFLWCRGASNKKRASVV